MELLGQIVAIAAVAFFVLMTAMRVALGRKARAMTGTALPVLPGAVGQRVANSRHALVYFFSPSCGACRAITPRVRALEATNPSVFAVDVTRSPDLARALNVMATPSTVEITDGTISGYHVGPIPEAVLARFTGALPG